MSLHMQALKISGVDVSTLKERFSVANINKMMFAVFPYYSTFYC